MSLFGDELFQRLSVLFQQSTETDLRVAVARGPARYNCFSSCPRSFCSCSTCCWSLFRASAAAFSSSAADGWCSGLGISRGATGSGCAAGGCGENWYSSTLPAGGLGGGVLSPMRADPGCVFPDVHLLRGRIRWGWVFGPAFSARWMPRGNNGAPPESVPSTISSSTPPASASRASHAREKTLAFFHGLDLFPRRRRTGAAGRVPCLLTGGSLRLEMTGSTGLFRKTRGLDSHGWGSPYGRASFWCVAFCAPPALGQPNLPGSKVVVRPPIKKTLPQRPHAARPDAPSAQPADPLPAESVAIYRHVGEDGTVFLTNRPDGDGRYQFFGRFSAEWLNACGGAGRRGAARGTVCRSKTWSSPGWSWRSSRSNRGSTPRPSLRPWRRTPIRP